jgi:hypothetical protein
MRFAPGDVEGPNSRTVKITYSPRQTAPGHHRRPLPTPLLSGCGEVGPASSTDSSSGKAGGDFVDINSAAPDLLYRAPGADPPRPRWRMVSARRQPVGSVARRCLWADIHAATIYHVGSRGFVTATKDPARSSAPNAPTYGASRTPPFRQDRLWTERDSSLYLQGWQSVLHRTDLRTIREPAFSDCVPLRRPRQFGSDWALRQAGGPDQSA